MRVITQTFPMNARRGLRHQAISSFVRHLFSDLLSSVYLSGHPYEASYKFFFFLRFGVIHNHGYNLDKN
jgi:hypothetical protein